MNVAVSEWYAKPQYALPTLDMERLKEDEVKGGCAASAQSPQK